MYTYIRSASKNNPRIRKPQSAIKFWTNSQPIFGVYRNNVLLSTNSIKPENLVGNTLADKVNERTNTV